MTAPSISEFPATTVLAAVAVLLLLFVSTGVVYLSTVEWRDRRRRESQQRSKSSVATPAKVAAGSTAKRRPFPIGTKS